MKVFQYKTPAEAFLKSMEYFIGNKSGKDNDVIIEIDDCTENFALMFPYESDNMAWLLRETSDWVVGQKVPGGLHLRYDNRRYRYIKRNGLIDWGYKDSVGPDIDSVNNEDIIKSRMTALTTDDIRLNNENLSEIEKQFQICWNRLGENPSSATGVIESDGQLDYVKRILISDQDTDKAIINFWRWKGDLAEYYHRRFLPPQYTDSIHRRTTCGLFANYYRDKQKLNCRFTIRHSVVYQHFLSDIGRPMEIARYLGRYINKEPGRFLLHAFNMRQVYYRTDKKFWENLINYYKDHSIVNEYYPTNPYKEEMGNKEYWDNQFELKELVETYYRAGAFIDAEEVEQKLNPYYRDWVSVIKLYEMIRTENICKDLKKNELEASNVKKSLNYLTDRVEGFLPTTVVWYNMSDCNFKAAMAVFLIKEYMKKELYKDAEYVLGLLKPEVQQIILAGAIWQGKTQLRRELQNKRMEVPYYYLDEDHYKLITDV